MDVVVAAGVASFEEYAKWVDDDCDDGETSLHLLRLQLTAA